MPSKSEMKHRESTHHVSFYIAFLLFLQVVGFNSMVRFYFEAPRTTKRQCGSVFFFDNLMWVCGLNRIEARPNPAMCAEEGHLTTHMMPSRYGKMRSYRHLPR
jgi:hypothetical protein